MDKMLFHRRFAKPVASLSALPPGMRAGLSVGSHRSFPVTVDGEPLILPHDQSSSATSYRFPRGVFDPRAPIRTFRDVCNHRALWQSAVGVSPFLVVTTRNGPLVLTLPGAAEAQVDNVDHGGRVVAATAVASLAASAHRDRGRISGHYCMPVESLLLTHDPAAFEVPRTDAEAVALAAHIEEQLGLRDDHEQHPHPAKGERTGDDDDDSSSRAATATEVGRHTPELSGPCHPSFWKVFKPLLRNYAEKGPGMCNITLDTFEREEVFDPKSPDDDTDMPAEDEEGEDPQREDHDASASEEPEVLVVTTAKALAQGQELLLHRGLETLAMQAAMAVLLHVDSVEKARWIEGLLLEAGDTAFPDVALARKPAVARAQRRAHDVSDLVLGDRTTRTHATPAAVLAATCRLSVQQDAFWQRLVRAAAASSGGSSQTATGQPARQGAEAVSDILDAPFTVRDLRTALKQFLWDTKRADVRR
jgi:hypothetical protein